MTIEYWEVSVRHRTDLKQRERTAWSAPHRGHLAEVLPITRFKTEDAARAAMKAAGLNDDVFQAYLTTPLSLGVAGL